MDIVKELEQLEDKYYGEWEEEKQPLIDALLKLHAQVGTDENLFNRFLVQCSDRFGGAYVPYLFWDKLAYFLQSPEERAYLQQLLKSFVESNFDEDEQKKMKPLLVCYFATEKKFEVDKVRALVIDKSHPTVQDYFHKLISFVEKNQKSTEMYVEKFRLLKEIHPDFNLLNLPITQLRDKMQNA
ncbi:hypothetical protein [Pontibacter sp. G13]|uniref:hypothetical protein n=1 Tax=Pontibacter sp. G13 TaxID=3074898 RepID=UPI002889ABE5|nr:hypothetical protein [Pontibacter sp. G13]WNJ15968.1 hypothetical protein RJD25_13985 [Pontibacter sp. G13]